MNDTQPQLLLSANLTHRRTGEKHHIFGEQGGSVIALYIKKEGFYGQDPMMLRYRREVYAFTRFSPHKVIYTALDDDSTALNIYIYKSAIDEGEIWPAEVEISMEHFSSGIVELLIRKTR